MVSTKQNWFSFIHKICIVVLRSNIQDNQTL
jgi:hypothetical protein